MRFNSKLAWGLAWAGLAVVLAVPSMDFLTAGFGAGKTAALLTSTTDPVTPAAPSSAPAPVKTAAVTTTITKTGVTITPNVSAAPVLDPVNKLLKSGKPLPDYISNDGASSAVVATTAPASSSEEPTQVAAIDPVAPAIAPVPFPQRPPDIVRPALPRPTQPPVVVDENALATADASPRDNADVGPLPPAGLPDDWQSMRRQRLNGYLERNGLISGQSTDGRSSVSVTEVAPPSADSNYDADGFYLSDGPNMSRAERRARLRRLFEEDDDGYSDFTSF